MSRPGADTTATVAVTVNTGNVTGTFTSGGVALGGGVVQALSAGPIKGTAISDSSGLYVSAN